MDSTPPLPGACRKRIKAAKGKLNLNFFTDMQPEVADNIPWDVNGNKIYAIPTTEEFWHDKQMDRRHWTFTTSSKKGLDGKCKFGTCQGSLICMNLHCPVFTTEGVCNQIDMNLKATPATAVDIWLQENSVDASKSLNLINRKISLQYDIKVNISVT